MENLEIRNPTSRSQLLKMITKYEDKYLRRESQGPSNSNERRDRDEWRRLPNDRRSGNWRDAGVFERQNDRRGTNRSTYENRPRGTMFTKGSRTGTILTELIVGSRIVVVGISSEIRVRVTILTEVRVIIGA
ncbi:hypothetical protein TNCV_3528181 [Trichonephila clavipes]|nr:hypothetical protein TNCV_3528181 [Trichonephila clavipes]